MYINLKKWREDGIRKKCIDYFNAPENADKIQFGEQDVINKICMRHIMELPIEFNMFTMFYSHDLSTVPDKYVSDWVSLSIMLLLFILQVLISLGLRIVCFRCEKNL